MTILTRNNQCLELRGTSRRRRPLGMALSGEEGDNENRLKERSSAGHGSPFCADQIRVSRGLAATGLNGLSISYGPGLVAPGGGPPPHPREDGSFYLKQSSAPSLPTAPMYQVMWTD